MLFGEFVFGDLLIVKIGNFGLHKAIKNNKLNELLNSNILGTN